MSMSAYTKTVKDGMRFKHGAQVRFTVRSSVVLEDRLVDAGTIGGAFTVASITYNRLSMSGGVSWWNPATGESISRPRISMRARPQDVLVGTQECDCSHCVSVAVKS